VGLSLSPLKGEEGLQSGPSIHVLILISVSLRLKPTMGCSLPGQRLTRLYAAEPLGAGARVALDPAQAHRLQHVLRLGPDAAVAVFNAADGEWLCRIAELGRRGAVLAVVEQRRPPEADADVWLVFAPIKRARLDWLVEKATELGAAALVPVWTARTQPERLNPERLRGIAIAAAEQSERLSLPEIQAGGSLTELIAVWPAGRRLILCDETGAGPPIGEALAGFAPDIPVAVLIGPEGGFAETELDALGKLPIVTRVGLGPRVLRAETAALAALAAFQAIAGDWRRRRSA
jgi:16S rRNA (uracil1498-N3)-methyltransferase